MTEIIQKNFEDLRKGDRVLIEVTICSQNGGIAYFTMPGGYTDTVDPNKYHGCLAPEPPVLKIGMAFRYHGSDAQFRIYAIKNGKAFYFRCERPDFINSDTSERLASDSSLIWIEE